MNKNHTVKARVSAAERHALTLIAEKREVGASEMLRRLIRQSAEADEVWTAALELAQSGNGQELTEYEREICQRLGIAPERYLGAKQASEARQRMRNQTL